ncbi:protein TSSC4 [Acanthochromis polyacanthus]|uniref:protein TSSC4 n=1 Tax=Acanthochromis polyacanthus TaxID=80966 RepID=UPI002234D030|nr:protein TSSC4 [Acanthochromis polyacanthus]XP_022073248.2 protein TSSC4 [Acanthochromis polyacanthus]
MCDEEHFGEHSEMFISDDVDQLSASDESEPEAPPNKELDHGDDDDDDDDDSVPAALHKAQDSFSLSGGCSAFSDRCHSIFDSLDSVDRQTSSSLSEDNIRDILCTQPPVPSRKTSHLLSNRPTPKTRGVPDYLLHPERWTHYSLEDVPETSNRDNSKVALSFLSSLQQERKVDSSCDIQQRMIFSRAKRLMEEQDSDQLSTVRAKERRMHLSHLEEEDERERETEGSRTEKSVEKSEKKDKDEETDISGPACWPEDGKQVQKEKKLKESSQGFTYFRNTKAKNYRKSSECSDR